MLVKRVHPTRREGIAWYIGSALRNGAAEIWTAASGLVHVTRITEKDRRNGEWRCP
jgi:hypothetical protein